MKDYKAAYGKMWNECVNAIPKALSRGCGLGHEICFAREGSHWMEYPEVHYDGKTLRVLRVFTNPLNGSVLLKLRDVEVTNAGVRGVEKEQAMNIIYFDLWSLVNLCDAIRKWKQTYGR